MPLRNLTNLEMITVTRTWVDPGHDDHRLLLGQPTLAPFMPELSDIHRELLRTEPSAEMIKRLAAIQNEQRGFDDWHDVLMRAMDHRFLAEILMLRDPEAAAALRAVHQMILPRGLLMVNASYRDEVGHAESVASKLTAEHEQLLRRLGTHGGTMLDVVREWLATADQLGQLDHERRGIEVEIAGLGPNEVRNVRSRWIRMIQLIRTAAGFLAETSALGDLLARVARAESDADRRTAARRARNAGEPAAATEPENEPDDVQGDPDDGTGDGAADQPASDPGSDDAGSAGDGGDDGGDGRDDALATSASAADGDSQAVA